jgi:hypothetical protein
MRNLGFAVAATMVLAAAPAAASVTFNLGGSTTTLAAGTGLNQTVNGVTLTAKGYSFATTPNAFQALATGANAATVLSTLTAMPIRREAMGLGVCPVGEAGNQCNQVDTDGANEILRLILPTAYSLTSATFDRVDNNDTIKLYGVTAAGVVQYLGYGGHFDGAGTSTAFTGISGLQTGGSGEDQIYKVNFGTASYKEFWFTNNNDAADGYRLGSVTFGAVPEPQSWALMIFGFGLTGAAMRRRRDLQAVAVPI